MVVALVGAAELRRAAAVAGEIADRPIRVTALVPLANAHLEAGNAGAAEEILRSVPGVDAWRQALADRPLAPLLALVLTVGTWSTAVEGLAAAEPAAVLAIADELGF